MGKKGLKSNTAADAVVMTRGWWHLGCSDDGSLGDMVTHAMGKKGLKSVTAADAVAMARG